MRVDGRISRGRRKKIWMDCVRNDACMKGINNEMTVDE